MEATGTNNAQASQWHIKQTVFIVGAFHVLYSFILSDFGFRFLHALYSDEYEMKSLSMFAFTATPRFVVPIISMKLTFCDESCYLGMLI